MSDKARANDPRSEASKKKDLIPRGDYTSTPIGKTVFVVLRSLDPVLQYSILAHGTGTALLHRVGLQTLPAGLPVHTGIAPIDNLGLSPYRLILLSMAVGSAVKQDIWATMLSGEPMDVKNALIVSLFNTVCNSVNHFAFLASATSASENSAFPQLPLMLGGAMYAIGIVTELMSEVQRKQFKDDPKNKGKPFTGGLWSLARHINYGAYTVWRAGYALSSGGWILGGIVGTIFFTDFMNRGVPILNEYCEKRYGEDWEQFKKQTKWKLIPGIY
ncbi:hypothetical protein EJ04DRAFT_246949 [Polyplosphaeria fusca]|uniref:Steroid 5-alpha reductase C-terminal domain-containing protein n=1 Tax=Polyplosphaeria fusca TaxID=682080 RepID=A0A9P4R076_9PLEO|nr:hypothetical protein EJ04DRAFT_246949 [Polyplosphaeria fusca]